MRPSCLWAAAFLLAVAESHRTLEAQRLDDTVLQSPRETKIREAIDRASFARAFPTFLGEKHAVKLAYATPFFCRSCSASYKGTIFIVGPCFDWVERWFEDDPLTCPGCLTRRNKVHISRMALLHGFSIVVVATPDAACWKGEHIQEIVGAFKTAERRLPEGRRFIWGISRGGDTIPTILSSFPPHHFSGAIMHVSSPRLSLSQFDLLGGGVMHILTSEDTRLLERGLENAKAVRIQGLPAPTVITRPRLVSKHSLRTDLATVVPCEDEFISIPLSTETLSMMENEMLEVTIKLGLSSKDGTPAVLELSKHTPPLPIKEMMQKLETIAETERLRLAAEGVEVPTRCVYRTSKFYAVFRDHSRMTSCFHEVVIEHLESAIIAVGCLRRGAPWHDGCSGPDWQAAATMHVPIS